MAAPGYDNFISLARARRKTRGSLGFGLLVERTTRHTILNLLEAFTSHLVDILAQLRLSITYD